MKDKNGNSYQYVSGDKLLSFVRPKMDSLGLLLVPEVESSEFSRQDYTLYDRQGNAKPKNEMFCSLVLKFTWIDTESEEKLVCHWASSGQNNWDKGLGSALTYGERYFLLKFFHIQTDRDDVDFPREDEVSVSKEEAISYFDSCKTQDDLAQVWNDFAGEYGNDQDFRTAYMKRFNEINNGS